MAAKEENIVVVKENLQDITECCICTRTFKEPIILPCIHTFCLRCLSEAGSKTNRKAGDLMPCPLCRTEFAIPGGGFVKLPKNFFMDRLVEMMKVLNPSSDRCEPCSEGLDEAADVPAAEMYCSDCRQKMCNTCCNHHRRIKISKNHKLIQIGSKEFETARLEDAVAPSLCDQHEEEPLKMYCFDCESVSCALCFIDNHSNHHGSHVDKVVDAFRQQIQNHILSTGASSKNIRGKVERLEQEKKDVLQRISDLEVEVKLARDEVKALADRHAISLLHQLETLQHEKVKEIQAEKDDYERQIACLDNYEIYCAEMTAKGSASDVCRALSQLNARAADLQELYESTMQRQLQPFQVSFKKKDLNEYLGESGTSIIGVLEDNAKPKRKLKTNDEDGNASKIETQVGSNYKDEAIMVCSIPDKSEETNLKEIWGLAILGNELFIVSDVSSEVKVYDTVDCSFKRRFILESMIDPQDIVSCTQNKCLYIMDWRNSKQRKEILKVNPSGRMMRKWSTGSDFGRLSVSDEGHIIIAVIWQNKLSEYYPDGKLFHEIQLTKIFHPRHAVKLTSGLFVVCYGEAEDALHGVCLIDSSGDVMRSFGGPKGSTNFQVNCPLAVAVDVYGAFIVADEKNSRLLLLSSDLEFSKILATDKCGIRDPWRLHLDNSSGRLFVADNDAENKKFQVLVLDVK